MKSPKPPSYPQLPEQRTNLVTPFESIGVDFTGHFYTVGKDGIKSKMYILIFACMTTRAINLEVVDSMDANSFVLAFIRHCNLRGIPKYVLLDNAKSFISGAALLNEILSSEVTKDHFTKFHITFKFIPVYSPWAGASYERLIGIVKNCFYKTIGRQTLGFFLIF